MEIPMGSGIQEEVNTTPGPKSNLPAILLTALITAVVVGLIVYIVMAGDDGELLTDVPTPTPTASVPASPTASANPTNTDTPTSTPSVSERDTIFRMISPYAPWTLTENDTVSRIKRCTDGTSHNSQLSLFTATFGPQRGGTDADTNPPMESVVVGVQNVLKSNGWVKCTPNTPIEDTYYSNQGPNFMETYRKGGRLIQLNWNLSMGVGYNMMLQAEVQR